jgi:hypothetical protein
MRVKLQRTRGTRALQAALAGGPALSDADREAGRVAATRLAALNPTDPTELLAAGLYTYFEYTAGRHAGVAAAEALLWLLRSNPVHAQHFTKHADLPALLALLQPALPLR